MTHFLINAENPQGYKLEEILLAILGSIAMGTVLGWFVRLYLKRIRTYRILFILAVAFLAVNLGEWLSLEFILVAMAAGFYVQNFSSQGRRLLRALEANSLPIYAIFFAVAGADLDISVLRQAWMVASALVLTRLAALWISTHVGARLAADPPVIQRYAWMGFIAQAGVTLGIANMIRDRFPDIGTEIATIIVAMIAVNQLLGPPAFRWSVIKAGESRTFRRSRNLR